MSEQRPAAKLTAQQKTLWTILMQLLGRDLEACGLGPRALSQARVQIALYDDDRYLVHVLSRLAEHRRAHLN